MERRLAAILAADVVGYSRLVEANEEEAIHTLGIYRETIGALITSHHGRVFGTAGDSIIAEFASPVEAVRCAVNIQRSLETSNSGLPEDRCMRFRIGINLGDVLVEGDDLLGDGVNVAARIEAMTLPGGIDVSGTVYDQVKQKLDLMVEDLGARALKNIEEPVHVYRVAMEAPGSNALPTGRTAVASQAVSFYPTRLRWRFCRSAICMAMLKRISSPMALGLESKPCWSSSRACF